MSEYKLGDVVETKKPHPCGSRQWTIIRTGMDYKIKCKEYEKMCDSPSNRTTIDRRDNRKIE